MSRRIRVNRDGDCRPSLRQTWRSWVCRMIGHNFDHPNGRNITEFCLRCGRVW